MSLTKKFISELNENQIDKHKSHSIHDYSSEKMTITPEYTTFEL
jgi:hypothetical protein